MIYVRLVVLSTSPQNVANMWQRKNMLGRLMGLDLMEIESTKTWQECKQNELVNVLPIQTEKNHPEAPQGIFFRWLFMGFGLLTEIPGIVVKREPPTRGMREEVADCPPHPLLKGTVTELP